MYTSYKEKVIAYFCGQIYNKPKHELTGTVRFPEVGLFTFPTLLSYL